MTAFNKTAVRLLLIGDIVVFIASLWLTLFLRYIEVPDKAIFFEHLAPFSLLFVVWLLVFFISGLYDKQSVIFRSKLSGTLIQGQIANILVATAFFYFIPWYGISPKTTLFLYLLVSLCLILVWRVYGYALVAPKTKERAIVIGSGDEIRELVSQVGKGDRYSIDFVSAVDLDSIAESDFKNKMFETVAAKGISVVAVDLFHERVSSVLPHLYNLIFRGIRFIGVNDLYENVFDRVPLSLVRYNWFLENVSTSPKFVYDMLKRLMDILIAFALGALSLILYPFVAIAIKLDSKGSVFIFQERVGKNGKLIRIAKFRSMARNEVDLSKGKDNTITRVGSFLRKSRIDELPQLWNVLKGDLSLIGPRPELPSGVLLYEREIPYYGIRHLIKPGLSGWAQIYHENHPHHGEAVKETREKLSYDLYYVKNRSFILDLNIALKTIKALLSRKGA